MSRPSERPKLVRTDKVSGNEFSHPAYGRITLGKMVGGGGTTLFGSDLKHTNIVSIKIDLANEQRSLHNNRTRKTTTVCELMMSEAQWAHFISSAGMGDGNPVTFSVRPDGDYKLMYAPSIEREETLQETYEREVRESCEKAVANAKLALEQVRALAESGKANKGQLQQVASMLASVVERLPSSMAFAQDQFAETMSKTVNDGKIELETFVTNLAMHTGLEQLRASAPRLMTVPMKTIDNDTDQ